MNLSTVVALVSHLFVSGAPAVPQTVVVGTWESPQVTIESVPGLPTSEGGAADLLLTRLKDVTPPAAPAQFAEPPSPSMDVLTARQVLSATAQYGRHLLLLDTERRRLDAAGALAVMLVEDMRELQAMMGGGRWPTLMRPRPAPDWPGLPRQERTRMEEAFRQVAAAHNQSSLPLAFQWPDSWRDLQAVLDTSSPPSSVLTTRSARPVLTYKEAERYFTGMGRVQDGRLLSLFFHEDAAPTVAGRLAPPPTLSLGAWPSGLPDFELQRRIQVFHQKAAAMQKLARERSTRFEGALRDRRGPWSTLGPRIAAALELEQVRLQGRLGELERRRHELNARVAELDVQRLEVERRTAEAAQEDQLLENLRKKLDSERRSLREGALMLSTLYRQMDVLQRQSDALVFACPGTPAASPENCEDQGAAREYTRKQVELGSTLLSLRHQVDDLRIRQARIREERDRAEAEYRGRREAALLERTQLDTLRETYEENLGPLASQVRELEAELAQYTQLSSDSRADQEVVARVRTLPE